MDNSTIISNLVIKHLRDELSAGEQQHLENWIKEDPGNQKLFTEFTEKATLEDQLLKYGEADIQAVRDKIINVFPFSTDAQSGAVVRRAHFLRKGFLKYTAAVLLVVLGVSVYYFTADYSSRKNSGPVSKVERPDVLPGSDKAILTLSNGEQVQLNSASSETIKDGELLIQNNDGRLSYAHSDVMAINTMTTPKGGQYKLTLSDGTNVWLNAASSITFPTAFNGSVREVSITGEVYFEVARNKVRPFVVKTRKDQVRVLGTSFNINSYQEENAVKTSLVEGIIQIGNTIVKPGQAFADGRIISTDIQQDVAWRSGRFDFNNKKIEEVMRQLARWYDIEIQYKGKIPDVEFGGDMGRSLTLNQVLEGLQILDVHFELNNRVLTVTP